MSSTAQATVFYGVPVKSVSHNDTRLDFVNYVEVIDMWGSENSQLFIVSFQDSIDSYGFIPFDPDATVIDEGEITRRAVALDFVPEGAEGWYVGLSLL